MVKELIDKFLKRNQRSLESKIVTHQMNGVVLVQSGDAFFNLKETLIKEVLEYCRQQSIEKIDKIVFVSISDFTISDIKPPRIHKRVIADSESMITVTQLENGETVANVVFGEYLNIIDM